MSVLVQQHEQDDNLMIAWLQLLADATLSNSTIIYGRSRDGDLSAKIQEKCDKIQLDHFNKDAQVKLTP